MSFLLVLREERAATCGVASFDAATLGIVIFDAATFGIVTFGAALLL